MTTVYVDRPTADTRPLYRGTQIVWYILYLFEVLLAFRFVLRLIGANPAAGFTQLIYAITNVIAYPFYNVVRSGVVSRSVFEWSTIIAMIVYWVLAWAIIRLFLIQKPVSPAEADYKLEKQDPNGTI